MSEQATPKAVVKTVKFKPGVTSTGIPGHSIIGGINETHLKADSVQSLIRKARVTNPDWFNKTFIEE